MVFVQQIVEPILALPRVVKRAIALLMDAGLCVLTVWLAFYLRLGFWVSLADTGWPAALVSLFLAIPIFVVFGMYRTVFRFVSWEAGALIVQAVLVYGIIYSAIFTAFSFNGIPRTVGIIQPLLLLIALGATRAFAGYWLGGRYRQRLRSHARNVLIYGAGSAGQQLAAALSDSLEMRVVGFVDDARGLRGSVIGGIRVWAPDQLAIAVEQLDIVEVLLAVPSADRQRRNEILDLTRSTGVAVRTLPGLLDIASGRVTISDLKPLEIEDLLGRDPMSPQMDLLEPNIRSKTVLVTGAGGSIGSELCRQILMVRPKRLLLVEASEYALYTIHRDLERLDAQYEGRPCEIVPLLGSVCDRQRLSHIFGAWRPETVYHAAAYKHVPLVEHNVAEGVRNNLLGTQICASVARDFRTANFVLISTDKAVRPTNVMGATKRLSEMVLQALAAMQSDTHFSIVRFGNVLGSSGSVVPLFRQQIAAGGPVTVTHREITRYFMTIPEAAQLVLHAGAMAKGGEVFVLDMGEPVRIRDLAVRMIELSGFQVRDDQRSTGDIEIKYSGLRAGEKLYEELLIGDDPIATDHPQIMMAREGFLPWEKLQSAMEEIEKSIRTNNVQHLRDQLQALIPEYAPSGGLVDSIHCAIGVASVSSPVSVTQLGARP